MPDEPNKLTPEEARLVLKAIEDAEREEAAEQQEKVESSSGYSSADR